MQDYDDEFLIRGEQGMIYFKIETVYGFPNNTFAASGYDTQSRIEIESSNYSVVGRLYITTGEIHEFYSQLKNCYDTLTGTTKLSSYEGNLELNIQFDGLGHASVHGYFKEDAAKDNELRFEFMSDQTYLFQAIRGLSDIADKYGDRTGKKQ